MRRVFKWLSIYEAKAKKLKISQEVERAFEAEILSNPEKGSLLQTTGGLRKIRVAQEGRGKSGSFRFFYLDLEHVEKTYVFYVIAKNEKENISKEEGQALKEIVMMIKKEAKNEKD